MEDELLTIDLPLRDDAIIKVMGVGGGGCNAVNYMYSKGIKDVSFLVCNTDKQALGRSSVPAKLQLGPGLGAGGRPERAKELAEESRDRIREALNDGTQMLFLAAGMGGGTGTGATSIVAEVAQEMEILTVGIVTIPFAFEGKPKIRKAMTGVATLAEHVDALLVINNEKLRQIYPDLNLLNAFSKSDDVVCNAAKSIAEIITVPGYINTDFADVYNTLKDGKVAIMNVGQAGGEKRIHRAINNALQSPLINANDVHGAKRILLQLYCSKEHAILTQEIDQVHEFVQEVGEDVEVQWGISIDESLAEDVRVTIIATGYEVSDIPSLDEGSGNPSVDEAIVTNYPEEKAPAEEGKPQETKQEEEIEVTVTDTQPAQEEPKPAVPQANEAATDSQPVEIDLTDTIQQSQPVRRGFAAWMRGRR